MAMRPEVDRNALFVVIQTVPGREVALSDTIGSLEQSDLGEPDAIECASPGESMRTTFLHTLMAISKSGRPWGLRLEDDVLANRFALQNIRAWSASNAPDFGVGWLFVSGYLAKRLHFTERCGFRELVMSQAVLIPNVGIDVVAANVQRLWQDCEGQQDRALSRAIFESGKRVYVHYPPLFEHNTKHPSTLAPDRKSVPGVHDSGGQFDQDWRFATDQNHRA